MTTTTEGIKDLAPEIYRQRLIIEGYPAFIIEEQHIKDYLSELSSVCDMNLLAGPMTNRSPKFGWAGWIHWETSGTHFYGWRKPLSFFSVDIYTCKKFEVQEVVDFTRSFFKATEIVFKEV